MHDHVGVRKRAARRLAAVAAALLLATSAAAQASGVSTENGRLEPGRPGLIKLGGSYLTPYLRIGTLGVDTNVFYTPTERRTDFTANGGPGLELLRPLGGESRLRIEGGADYVYFLKTTSQRRLNGYGSALLDLHGVKTDLSLEARYGRTFSRPNEEVDARVQQETTGVRLSLVRRVTDHYAMAVLGSSQRTRTDSYRYLGTDLGTTLTEDRHRVSAELRRALSVKTQFVAGAEPSWYRFPRATSRDGRSILGYAGFRTDASALIGGFALAGLRWFEMRSGGTRQDPYVSVNATWRITPKTQLGGGYQLDTDYSSFATSGATPTRRLSSADAFLEKRLTDSLYFRAFGRIRSARSHGEVTIETGAGDPERRVRDDQVWEGGGELGIQLRSRMRIGLRASYVERESPFETFGIEGLLAGLTVQYSPPQPRFR